MRLELLAKNAVVRKARHDPVACRRLGSPVRGRHGRSVALGFDDQRRTEMALGDEPGPPRQLLYRFEE